MNRTALLPLLSVLFTISGIAADPPVDAAKSAHVLMIGLDGCRPDALVAAEAPVLHQLIAQGAFAADALSVPNRPTGADTVSGPGWSSILTGVWADKHGCVDNRFLATHYAEFPCLFARLRQSRPKAFLAAVSSWKPVAEKIVTDADVNLGTDDDGKTTSVAVGLLGEHDPLALFVHFDGVDHAGHAAGFSPQSAPYLAAIQKVDARVGELLAALKARPTYANESWLIVVCADHGGRGKNHGGGVAGGVHDPERTRVPVILAGPTIPHGPFAGPVGNVDLTPTVLRHLAIPVQPEWKLDGHPLDVTAAPPTGPGETSPKG